MATTSPLPDAELALLTGQVEEQLAALRAAPPDANALHKSITFGKRRLPAAPAQQAAIEDATGQPFESFWKKYLRHARKDLCLPGGILHDQWKKWRDLESKTATRTSYVWLAAMGIPTGSLGPVAVAATVFLLNTVLNIGIDAVCEGCAEEEKARAKAGKAPAAAESAKAKPKAK